MIGSLGPFTATVIQPTNDKLIGTPAVDADSIKEALKAWGKFESVRTYMSLVGLGGAVVATLGVEI